MSGVDVQRLRATLAEWQRLAGLVAAGDELHRAQRDHERDRLAVQLAVAQDGFGMSSRDLVEALGGALSERQVKAEIRVGRGVLRRRSEAGRAAA